ncbi:MAG: DUF2851 family protein [Chloroflexi bacterium]|nr:DUF2851 family protein [Chloroflexota bacterium]
MRVAGKGPPEGLVQKLWSARGTGRWAATDGREIVVGYPGQLPGGAGPDFRGALLSTEPGLPQGRGEIEVHVRSSGWRAHGHHRDPRYSGVGLEVVVWEDRAFSPSVASPRATSVAPGEVPVVVLGPAMGKGPLGQLAPAEPCLGAGQRRGWESLISTLEQAGLDRLRERAQALSGVISLRGPDQALYEAMMEALGYSQNRAPFLKLAQGLPFERLRYLGLPGHGQPGELDTRLYCLLLGAAGLGPSDTPDVSRVLAPEDWTTVGVRPANHPRRRLRAAATLLARHVDTGLSMGLQPYLAGDPARLEAALVVTGPGGGPAPLGRDRAREMAINAVLPFFLALSRFAGRDQRQTTAAALRLYTAFPAHGKDRVTRLLTLRLWGKPAGLGRACYQQGCHHIYQGYCLPRACGRCPLGV